MLRELLLKLLLNKEEEIMIAMLWAQKIMYLKRSYKDVPAGLKDQVREILVESGCEHLIVEE